MREPVQLVIAGLLACLALANALPGLFPRGSITTYKYYADLKTGAIEPAPFASQFVLSGLMHIRPELSDPNLKNAFYIMLDVTHSLRNGEIKHYEKMTENALPVPDAATELNDPFVIVFDDTGKIKSLMVNEKEAEWSRNMKRSIASMLQLDLSSIKLNMSMQPHSFITKENTVYGECAVAYDVHRTLELEEKDFTVTKIMTPMSCRNFTQYEFNLQESEGCLIEPEEEMTSASRRVFHIEYTGKDLLIKTLVAHGVINYFPWSFNTEAHYVLANQTMEFVRMSPVDTDTVLPSLDIEKMVTLDDVKFKKYPTPYIDSAGPNIFENFNLTHEITFDELTNMLKEFEAYGTKYTLEMIPPDMENGQIINRIINAMSYMNLLKLESFSDHIKKNDEQTWVTFVIMIPYVGTTATCLFARNMMTGHEVTEVPMILQVLSALPFYIRMPTEELLISMERLMDLHDLDKNIHKAGVLSFATMIQKTYKYESTRGKMNPKLIDKYVKHYYDHVISNETTYEMKIVYLHAMKNIEIGGVNKILEPIIRGEINVSEKPEHLRLHAMLVNWKATDDFEYIHNLYWPILANTKLPLELRICAYTILIKQPPRMERMMNLYWFMVYEKNEHLYNYHYTTLKSLAYTSNPCLRPMTEMARKIFRFTRVRPVSNILTGAWLFDYQNKEFGFGESVNIMMAADELTGSPYIGMIEYTTMKRHKSVNSYTYWLRLEGLDHNFGNMLESIVGGEMHSPIEKIISILEKASKDMPLEKPFHLEFALMMQGRTVLAFTEHNRSFNTSLGLLKKVSAWITMDYEIHGGILFSELYTKLVPNDLGLPTLLRNNIPRAYRIAVMKPTHAFELKPYIAMGIKIVLTDWCHGYHSMEVYNPIIKTWHAIRRMSALDINLPIDITLTYNATYSFKLDLHRLSATNHTDVGLRSHVQNYVMVIGKDKDVLKRHCPSCHFAELITQGAKYRKTTELMNLDSEDTALHFSFHQYDCERVSSPNPRFESSGNMFDKSSKNTWQNDDLSELLRLSEYRALIFVGAELGNCGYLFKLKPSIVYPASSVSIQLRWDKENSFPNDLRVLAARTIHVRGTLQVNSIKANTSVLTWTMHTHLNINEGHLKTELHVKMTREMPGKNNLQICITGQKTYVGIDNDILEPLNGTQYNSTGKLVITMSETNGSDCVSNDTSITINTKSEMSSEQEEALEHLRVNGECQKDVKNHWYFYNENSILPRTPACLREAIFGNTLRKTTYTLVYKKIPQNLVPKLQWISDIIRADLLPYAKYSSAYTKPGEMTIVVEHPLDDKRLNLAVRTPTHEVNYTGIFKLDGWKDMLDNARFSQSFMDEIEERNIKFCTIYPKVLINTDGAVMPFALPNKWTLLIGDYIRYRFSVFVKLFEPKKLGLLMSFENHTIEVVPSDTIPNISLDGEVVDYQSSLTLPSTLHTIKMIWRNYSSTLELEYDSFYLEWSNNFASLGISNEWQGQVTGLCGHLDGTHTKRMATVYTLED